MKSPFFTKVYLFIQVVRDNIKKGTNRYDQSYLVGRVIEVNYTISRVLVCSDLNSNVPVTLAPQNIQAIVTGSGDSYGQSKYIKGGLYKEFDEESIIYASGSGPIFQSAIPIGALEIINENSSHEFSVEFYSDLSQLKYVQLK
jgi:Cell shape-determining protein